MQQTLNSGAINTFTDSLPVHVVLEVKSPPIVDEELELPRESRGTHLTPSTSV